jgi:hypothetical protein
LADQESVRLQFGTLTSQQRGLLAKAVASARREAEAGAGESLKALAVDHHEPFAYMNAEQRKLRVALREHGRQLGDARDPKRGTQKMEHLAHEVAFEHWHRMLFARFLAENELLIHPEQGVAVSIADCIDLAREQNQDPWALAASFAEDMLPQIFRKDDPALRVALPTNRRASIEKILADLPADIFITTDALGWTYQFWQSDKKAEVNGRGEAVGADDISAVTQLFTEHYMVEFLLHNTLGAWHAGKMIAANPALADPARSESEVRQSVAIDGCDWKYLRLVRVDAGENGVNGPEPAPAGPWRVAAGSYPTWPTTARDITILESCLGSGHIFVTAFEIMVALRRHEEGLDLETAILKTLTENMFGLELDPRCAQIGVFAVALHTWKLMGKRGPLPKIQVACCGYSVGGSREAWVRHANGDSKLANGMAALYDMFEKAPLLGSLIDPDRMIQADLLAARFDELSPLVAKVLASSSDDAKHEAGIAASGMVEAVGILNRHYTLVVTNPPYLGRGKQVKEMKDFADKFEKDAKQDLATMFVSRALRWCGSTGTIAMVLPQNWLFLTSYKKLRERLLKEKSWTFVARLGPGAFQEISGEVVQAALVAISSTPPEDETRFLGIDVSNQRGERPILAAEKAERLKSDEVRVVPQVEQLRNPDARVIFTVQSSGPFLSEIANAYAGIQTGDGERFFEYHWEQLLTNRKWETLQSTVHNTDLFGGSNGIICWDGGNGELYRSVSSRLGEAGVAAWLRGKDAWGRKGVCVSLMGGVPCCLYQGGKYDLNCAVIIPNHPKDLIVIWTQCSSAEYGIDIRAIDQSLKLTNSSLVKVPSGKGKWDDIAASYYPKGLPNPQSNDPTQWLFHGHPAGMLAAGLAAVSPFAIADHVGAERHPSLICRTPNAADALQVAVARLAGYCWPAENDPAMELDEASRDWATRCKTLIAYSDDDGIVPINPMRGEPPAEERVIALLRQSFMDVGAPFDQGVVTKLIAATGSKATNLTDWLLNDFFDQHCKLFHHRPFVWHIWDGRKDGFNVLIHYHRLAAEGNGGRQLLEKMTFSYLKDWIDRQEAGVKEGASGADARLAAATTLQKELKLILEGSPPHDIFIRWKSLSAQPIGWSPDINDGVRVNIRPFMMAKDMGKKGAGLLRGKPNIKWTKDRGTEPQSLRPKAEFPWFWGCEPETNTTHINDFLGGREFTGERWNELHYTLATKQAARTPNEVSKK